MSRPRTMIARSSAKAVIGPGHVGKLQRRLLRTRFQRKGDSTPPWGHPETAETIRVLLARVRIVDRELMRAVIQFVMVTPVPERMRASWMALKEIRSKAPSMSRNTPRA